MTLEYLLLLAIIAVLSVVQSIFGMGVLVFGTPTLLILGYDFITALGYLLPASFAISLLQVLSAGQNKVPISKYLYLLCLPGIGVGLLMVEKTTLASWTNTMIGGTLVLSALVRFWSPSKRALTVFLEKYFPIYHLIMGLVHGLTNLGGALLSILASGINTDKVAIRYTVAHYYLAFSAIQMTVLAAVMGQHSALIASLPMAVVSALVYLLIGNRIFIRASNPAYNTALTIFIAVYGVIVLLDF